MLMKFKVGSSEIAVETEESTPSTTAPRVEKASLATAVQGATTAIQLSLGEALAAVAESACAFYTASGSAEVPPEEVEVSFGLKASTELNGFVVAKVGGEANFSVKMVWKTAAKK